MHHLIEFILSVTASVLGNFLTKETLINSDEKIKFSFSGKNYNEPAVHTACKAVVGECE